MFAGMAHFLRFCISSLLKGFANRELGLGSRLHVDTGAGGESCKELAVYNYWTGLVDWTGTLEWWTDIKNHFYAFLETHSPVGLHDV